MMLPGRLRHSSQIFAIEADRGVVGHVGIARHQLGAVLGGVAGKDHILVRRVQHIDEATGRMAGRKMRGDAGENFLAFLGGVQLRVGLELAHIKLRHRRLAPRHRQRPVEFMRADDDARIRKHRIVHRMIVVRMRQQQVGDLRRLQSAFGKTLEQHGAHAEAAGIDHQNAAVRAQHHDGAPPKAAMADRLAGKALHDNVEIVFAEFHGVFEL
jgi:hypothetical protein